MHLDPVDTVTLEEEVVIEEKVEEEEENITDSV